MDNNNWNLHTLPDDIKWNIASYGSSYQVPDYIWHREILKIFPVFNIHTLYKDLHEWIQQDNIYKSNYLYEYYKLIDNHEWEISLDRDEGSMYMSSIHEWKILEQITQQNGLDVKIKYTGGRDSRYIIITGNMDDINTIYTTLVSMNIHYASHPIYARPVCSFWEDFGYGDYGNITEFHNSLQSIDEVDIDNTYDQDIIYNIRILDNTISLESIYWYYFNMISQRITDVPSSIINVTRTNQEISISLESSLINSDRWILSTNDHDDDIYQYTSKESGIFSHIIYTIWNYKPMRFSIKDQHYSIISL